MPEFAGLFVLGYFLASAKLIAMLVENSRRHRYHPTFKILTASVVCDAHGYGLMALHFLRLAHNGVGYPTALASSEVLFILSELLLLALATLLSQAWSLDPTRHNLRHKNFIALLGGTYVGAYFVLLLSQYANSFLDLDAGHFYESTAGQVLCVLRGVFFVGFVVFMVQSIRWDTNLARVRFYHKILVFFSVWIASLPVLVVGAAFLAPYFRYKTITILQSTTKAVAHMCLSTLLWPQSRPGEGMFFFSDATKEPSSSSGVPQTRPLASYDEQLTLQGLNTETESLEETNDV
eukprot:c16815_g1_i2.p1 GENE.c16815_g1_i2~~c16815_g1_i2.p1  ORF type:complete len:292 (+),score=53.73 c16815_g1_i2:557-1432(+)